MALLDMPFWRRPKTYRAKPPAKRLREQVNNRQEKVEGYDLDLWHRAAILALGAGGVSMSILNGCGMKGLGRLYIYDDDRIDLSNLTRQPYRIEDVGKYKVYRAAKQLVGSALFPLTVTATPRRFQECFSPDHAPKRRPDLIICGVDNNPTRRAVSAFSQAHRIPIIHAAVGRDANATAVFVEEPGQACWGCAFPHLINDNSYPCRLPGTLDVLMLAAGLAIAAADSLICARPREWNFRQVYIDGALPDRTRVIERRPDCPICGDPEKTPNTRNLPS